MKFFKKWPIRLVVFLAIFLGLNCFIEFIALKPNYEATVVMHDMKREENIDIIFAGDSIVQRHVDTEIMEETLSSDCFDLALSSAYPLTIYAMVEEMYHYHLPKTVVWIYSPEYKSESLIIEAGLRPLLSGWKSKISYALKSAETYGAYLDRLFPWRQDLPDNIKEIQDNINAKIDVDTYYKEGMAGFCLNDGTLKWDYNGKGYHFVQREPKKENLHIELNRKVGLRKDIDFSTEKEVLQKLKCLCEKNDGKLIVISFPALPQVLLGDQNVIYCLDNMEQCCQENGVPYLDMARVKPEILPKEIESYYYDSWHITKGGAEKYSRVLARVIKEYLDGQNVFGYFYTPEEFLKANNYILNGWYKEEVKDGGITYTADCIYGADVEPQYQFSAVSEGGEETLLKRFSKMNKFTCPQKDMEGKKICVTIRNAMDLEQEYVTAIKQ